MALAVEPPTWKTSSWLIPNVLGCDHAGSYCALNASEEQPYSSRSQPKIRDGDITQSAEGLTKTRSARCKVCGILSSNRYSQLEQSGGASVP